MRFLKNAFFAFVLAVMTLPSHALALAGWTTGSTNAGSGNLPGGATPKSLYDYIAIVFNWILAVLGFIAVAGFVWAGILYLTAGGDTEKAETAKKAMIYSVIGVLVALMGWVVINIVSGFLGGTAQF